MPRTRRPKQATPRDCRVGVKLSTTERDTLKALARDAGQCVGAYIWQAVEERAALDMMCPPPGGKG